MIAIFDLTFYPQMTFKTVTFQTYDNNWIFGIVFGIFVYAGMGILLPELDKSIENSAQQGTSLKFIKES